jgi:hypothetical protein
MIRQTDIPPVSPGEPISASLLNQIIKGANTGRVVTGDGNIEASVIGGNLGLSLNQQPSQDAGVLVQIQPPNGTDGTSTTIMGFTANSGVPQTLILPGGVYLGRLYTQPFTVLQSNTQNTATGYESIYMPTPVPAANNCLVINTSEVEPLESTESGTKTANGKSKLITKSLVIGRIIGEFRGWPLVAATAGDTVKGFSARITSVSGSFPTFDYTVQKIASYNTTLSNAAKWVTDGVSIASVKNRAEFGGTPPYTYGNGMTITSSTGQINSTSCLIKAIGVGAGVDVTMVLNESRSAVYSFSAMNSGQ